MIEQAYRHGRPLPKAIQEAPELWSGLELYFNAWVDLDSCRAIGMVAGPIPWTAVEDYCKALGLDQEQRSRMHRLIRAMDIAYMEHQRHGKS